MTICGEDSIFNQEFICSYVTWIFRLRQNTKFTFNWRCFGGQQCGYLWTNCGFGCKCSLSLTFILENIECSNLSGANWRPYVLLSRSKYLTSDSNCDCQLLVKIQTVSSESPINQSEIMLGLSFQRPSSVFRDRVQTSSAHALPIIVCIHWKRDIIMCILQNNAYSPICIIVESTHYYTCFTH